MLLRNLADELPIGRGQSLLQPDIQQTSRASLPAATRRREVDTFSWCQFWCQLVWLVAAEWGGIWQLESGVESGKRSFWQELAEWGVLVQ
jgi:hypothetical protein